MRDVKPGDIKMIALDLDGTLLDEDKHVPDANREALREAASRGVTVVLASGRMTDCITPFARELGLDCMVVAYNGGMARGKDADGRPVLHHCPLEAEYGAQLIDFCRDRYMLNYYVDDCLYAQENAAFRTFADDVYSARTRAKYHFVPDLAPLAQRDPTKAIIVVDHATRDRLHDEWAERWADLTTIVKTDPEYLEFLNRNTDKGVALAGLARGLGLDMAQVMAMGDGDNDATMLKAAGWGVAVANATPLTKDNADVVSDLTHQDCAVAAAVKRYVLGA